MDLDLRSTCGHVSMQRRDLEKDRMPPRPLDAEEQLQFQIGRIARVSQVQASCRHYLL
jgi:hypothetical protein